MNIKEYEVTFNEWLEALKTKQKAANTISTYRNGLNNFLHYLNSTGFDSDIELSTVLGYKQYLVKEREAGNLKTSTVNSRITVLNKFFRENGLESFKLKQERVQNKNSLDEMLSDTDYKRLIRWATKLGMERERLIMQTLAGTGARINELQFFTVENLKKSKDKITVNNKGKERSIVLPDKIRLALLKYAKQEGIKSGIIFHANQPRIKKQAEETEQEFEIRKQNCIQTTMLDKAQIWRNLKKIAGKARVKKSKVHAHSFRHLFAKTYLDTPGADILTLADLLGHSSIETTRRYTRKTSKEQKSIVNELFNQIEEKK